MSEEMNYLDANYYHFGAKNFCYLVRNFGLKTTDKLLDIGCGSLRLGRHLIPYLDPEKYHGVEPEEKWSREGLKYELSETMIDLKKPKFSYNPEFNFEAFGGGFDFAVACQVFIHCGSSQLEQCLINLSKCMSVGGIFVLYVKFAHEHSEQPKREEQGRYKHSDYARVFYDVKSLKNLTSKYGFFRDEELSAPFTSRWRPGCYGPEIHAYEFRG